MSRAEQAAKTLWSRSSGAWPAILCDREDQVFLALTLVIGAVVGAVVVAFILLTERFGTKLYAAGGMGLRDCWCPWPARWAWAISCTAIFPRRGAAACRKRKPLCTREGVARSTTLDVLPVVSRANKHQLRGVVTLQDVLAEYGVEKALKELRK